MSERRQPPDKDPATMGSHLLRVSRAKPNGSAAANKQAHSNIRNGKLFIWYADSLWKLAATLRVSEITLDAVKAWTGAPALDEDCWFGGRAPTLREVAKHCRKINAASFEHPIILNDDGTLMDGGHRLCKALLEGRTAIKAVQFQSMPPPDEEHDLPKD